MNEPASTKVSAHPSSGRLLKFSRLSIAVMLLLIVGGVGALIYVSAVGGEMYAAKEKKEDDESPPFSEELNFGPDEELMYTLSHVGGKRAATTIDKVVADGDKRFIPVLIEMLEAGETQPFVFGAGARRHILGLRELTGTNRLDSQSMETLSRQWRNWYVTSDVPAPKGFTGWKGKLYSRLDSRFEDFFKNEFESSAKIRPAETMYGGVQVDEIPSLDRPIAIDAQKADYLLPDELVFGIEINGVARAYPRRILDRHEIVNDEVGGVPIAVTYCPLSGAGIAYHALRPDGQILTFGTSGLVYRSNKLMYDHETNTLWNQLTGSAAQGPLTASSERLDPVPMVLTTWGSWQKLHPQSSVLDLNTGFQRRYQPAIAYGDYESSDRVMFTIAPISDALTRKTQVFGMWREGTGKVFSVSKLAEQKVHNDTVGATPVVLLAPEGTVKVTGRFRRRAETQVVSYDAGGPVRAYERGDLTFALGTDPTNVVDSQGQSWKVTEAALVGPDGRTLKRLPGFQSYWFAWQQFHPDAPLYQ